MSHPPQLGLSSRAAAVQDAPREERVCHYCELLIADGDAATQDKTKTSWAHVTCWYDQSPFEREGRDRAARECAAKYVDVAIAKYGDGKVTPAHRERAIKRVEAVTRGWMEASRHV